MLKVKLRYFSSMEPWVDSSLRHVPLSFKMNTMSQLYSLVDIFLLLLYKMI